MPRKSLTACPAGIEKARTALTGKGWSYEKLAEAIEVQTRQPVGNFFNGKGVASENFVAICRVLELNWQEIAGQFKPTDPGDSFEKTSTGIDIDALVQEVREKIKPYIQACCGEMRVLDMTQPIGLNDIYTDVNILEKITGRRRLEITELLKDFDPEKFDRFGLSDITQERVPGIQAVQQHSKLMVLGKPGAGKTTFLKHLAMQCIEGQFQSDRFPIFITLKDFAEVDRKPNIFKYISQQLSKCDVVDVSAKLIQLLKQGKVLVLLDGLDEVREENDSRVIKQIREFTEQYRENQIVVTCRIAAKEYIFKSFVEVEVADFDDQQIKSFAHQWFKLKKPGKAEKFIQKLQEDKSVKELATNPLLLTLLCLIFEEKGKFKTNRSELYEEGIELLLEKWDDSRDIEREQIYKNLSTRRKEDLLSKIALTTFESGDYFFKSRNAQELIYDYIYNLPDAQTEPEALRVDSKKVLKSIEAQHGLLMERAKGIYSFSHLTFHEFFTARKITLNHNSQQVFQQLNSHITDKRWREVFLLTVEILTDADDLLRLMKDRIEQLVATDYKLQQFLTWVEEKSRSVDSPYKSAAVRAFYFDLANSNIITMHSLRDKIYSHFLESTLPLALDNTLALAFGKTLTLSKHTQCFLNFSIASSHDLKSTLERSRDLYLDFYLKTALETSPNVDFDSDHNLHFYLERTRNLDRNLSLSLELNRSLQQLKDQLPDVNDEEAFKYWCQENGQAWAEQLRAVMIEHRNIGHDWQFSNEQKKLLQQYHDANKLLVDCLNSECYVSREVRQQIEDTLLLPVKTTHPE
ncbi:MAG: NACHT domain-containing NTPase [Nostoc sp.]|uniref:NACHT domain-containing NTPase n=1 Tax=Nostoc sp. TaxID=1180 RepID=UPI002FF12406